MAAIAATGAAVGAFVVERQWSGDGWPGPAPDPDGFYQAGTPGDGPRGEVLAQQQMDVPVGAPPGTLAYRVRYRTLDAAGRPVAASLAVAVPNNEAPTPRPIVAWVHGAVGVAPGCGPSRTAVAMPYAKDLLAAGVVVVAPDLTGLGVAGVPYPYLHGVTAGRSVLDAARAVARLPEARAGEVVALAGHSAGGHAAMWANQLASGSDGEGLDVRIAVVLAPIGDLGVAMQHYATTKGNAAFPVQLVSTWSGQEPVDARDVLTPEAIERGATLQEQCLGGLLHAYRGDPTRWVQVSGLRSRAWADALSRQSAGAVLGSGATLVIQGDADTAVRPAWTKALLAAMERSGNEVSLSSYPDADHGGIIVAARTEASGALIAALR